jgi:branched-chain amino acid transport system ATP-binding protein
MLSLAPALANRPTIAIVDEPTLGLAPLVASDVLAVLVELAAAGTTVVPATTRPQQTQFWATTTSGPSPGSQ